MLELFATAPLGVEALLADEVAGLGGREVKPVQAGAAFRGSLETAYRVCLWSRTANRVLLTLDRFPAADAAQLYDGVARTDWSTHLAQDRTFAVDFVAHRSRLKHTLFGAQKVKDAIVDQFSAKFGRRPSVRRVEPDLRINLYLDRDEATVSVDLSGESLHRRGYRLAGGAAPLKENLAAAILLRAGWPESCAASGELVDPMCGSGTFLIEGALIAGDIAPGCLRRHFGFFGWRQHDPILWERLLAEAVARREAGQRRGIKIRGYDIDGTAIRIAWDNIERAGLRSAVHVERGPMRDARPTAASGLLVVNPPYGERLGVTTELKTLYADLGETVREHFQGWKLALLTGDPELAFRTGIRATRHYSLYNGAIPCKLFTFNITPERYFTPRPEEPGAEALHAARTQVRRALRIEQPGENVLMLVNRLKKNLKTLDRWARSHGVDCFRLYDADLPEYAVAVDLYRGDGLWVHVQEYEAPATVDPRKAEQRLSEALWAIDAVLQVGPENLFLKVRRKQKGREQYDKHAALGRFIQVAEYGQRFWVNFEDYLDTGLFLDHRDTRRMLKDLAAGRDFLNLFAYTGSASVYAARGGARSTTSVDLSNTYLDWAKRNFQLNGIDGPNHRLIQAESLEWLEQAERERRYYGLIFLDPPTFSNSKRMHGTFEVQRDHVALLTRTAALLTADGVLIFSTNYRRFKPDLAALPDLMVEDITRRTIPRDFARNPKIHHCFRIQRAGDH